jgi:O-antigen ligase
MMFLRDPVQRLDGRGGVPQSLPNRFRREQRAASFLLRYADLLSIEAAFVLYVFAGRYKGLPELRRIPVDLTLLMLLVTYAAVASALATRRLKPIPLNPVVLSMIGFGSLAAASFFWSSMGTPNSDKLMRFLVLTGSAFFFAYMIGQDWVRRERLLRLIAGFSCLLLFYYVYYRWLVGSDPLEGAEPNRDLNGNNYLEYSDHAGMLFLVLFTFGLFSNRWQFAASSAGSALALLALAAIGGRGHLVFSVLAVPGTVILLLFFKSKNRWLRLGRILKFASFLAVTAALSYAVLLELKGPEVVWAQLHTLERAQSELQGSDEAHSLEGRIEGQEDAFEKWLEKPILGWGIGEFRIQHETFMYPHNLLLEILMELGVVGAVLFFFPGVIAAGSCLRTIRVASRWVEPCIALMFLTSFAAHLSVAGYLADDRVFFMYLGLTLGMRTPLFRRYSDRFRFSPSMQGRPR